jgi:hypothetical protein
LHDLSSMHTDTSHIKGRGRAGRSAKPIPGWAVVALTVVALAILLSAFLAFSPLFSQEAISDDIVPAEPVD